MSERRAVLRQALSIALAVVPFGVAFGVACSEAGLRAWEASAMSVVVFSGSAQFAAVDILGGGGTATSAVLAGLLLNLRSLAFGVAMASALVGPRWKRAVWSQLMIDESTAVGSAQPTPDLRRFGYLAAGAGVFVTWNVATLLGVQAVSSAGDAITTWGIDATIPAAFLALLWPRLRRADQRAAALAGAAIALVLVPVLPPGVPIVLAAAGILAGWRIGY